MNRYEVSKSLNKNKKSKKEILHENGNKRSLIKKVKQRSMKIF